MKGVEDMPFDFDVLMEIFSNEDVEIGDNLSPNVRLHGPIIGTRFDAYYDVTIYEDGYEERYYVGD